MIKVTFKTTHSRYKTNVRCAYLYFLSFIFHIFVQSVAHKDLRHKFCPGRREERQERPTDPERENVHLLIAEEQVTAEAMKIKMPLAKRSILPCFF